MAENVQSNIIINVDTKIGIAEIKNLQRQVASLNAQLLKSGAAQARAAENVQRNLINNINATGQFAANVRNITSTTENFTNRLEKNKLGLGEYFRYAGGASKTFGRFFRNEFDTIEKVARERVKTIQTQFTKLGRNANGSLQAIAVRPLALDMNNLATKTEMAAQKQQIFNQLVKQGSTNLLNFGKNTQWAGRQLMVGFSIPLAYIGTIAAKTFMQMEEQAIRFKRVYGDSFTASSETDKMVAQIKDLANEFTKYGVAVEKTMKMAADAAAMGKMGADLLAQVGQATRLAVLGGVEQDQALQTTISLTNAFGLAAEDLTGKINFLNAVENQTVTSIEDLTIAVPKAGPVIQQLGGDVEDLTFFLTAMREGGINASEGANALKSGLASMINPAEKTSKFLASLGVNIKQIVDSNAGDVTATVIELANALNTLDPLNRSRAIEQLFGKFQFSRLSTLFQNVVKEGTQAERVLKLSSSTAEELAILSERELKRIEDSPMYKFKKAVEDIKVSLVPLGEAFLKAVTPIVEFVKGFLDKFNEMSDGAKQFTVLITTVVAGIGPILLMTFGLIANGAANIIKLFAGLRNMFSGLGGQSNLLGSQTEYLTQQQLEAAAVASSLDQKHAKLIQTFTSETGAVNNLATAYARAVVAQSRLLGVPLGAVGKTLPKDPNVKKYKSGVVSVPGPKGAGDVVPAMLSPGEAVIPTKMAQKYGPLINSMISDNVPGYMAGKVVDGAVTSPGPKVPRNPSLSLPPSMTFESSHLSPIVGENLTKTELTTMFNEQLEGAEKELKRRGINKQAVLDDFEAKLKGMPESGLKLYSNMIEPFTKLANQATANPNSKGMLGSDYLKSLKSMPQGLFGSGILSRLPRGHNISDASLKSYILDVEKSFTASLNSKKSAMLKESDLQRMYLVASNGATRKIKNPAIKRVIDQSNSFAKLGLTPGAIKSGTSYDRLYITPLLGNVQKNVHKARLEGTLSRIFGDNFSKTLDANFLSKSKIEMPNRDLFDRANTLLGSLSEKDSKRFSRELVKASDIVNSEKKMSEFTKLISAQEQNKPYSVKMPENIRDTVSGSESAPKQRKRQPVLTEKIPISQLLGQSKEIPVASTTSMPGGKFGKIAQMFKKLGIKKASGTSSVKPFSRASILSAMLSRSNVGVRMKSEDFLFALANQGKNASYQSAFSTGTGADYFNKTGSANPKQKMVRSAMERDLFGLDPKTTPASARPTYGYARTSVLQSLVNNLLGTGGKNFNALTANPRSKSMDLYGNIDLITKSSVAKRSSAYAGDTLMNYVRAVEGRSRRYPNFDTPVSDLRMPLAPMRGASQSDMAGFERLKSPFGANKYPGENSYWTNPKSPYIETQTPGGFAFREIQKIIAKDPAIARQLRSELKSVGLGSIRVSSPNFISKLFSKMGIPGYNSGIVSVPGPKGKGDVVPAMLSPGEAVIPTKMAKKYGPLISSMISGNIPGYDGGYDPLNDPFRPPSMDPKPFGTPSDPATVDISEKSNKKLGATMGRVAGKFVDGTKKVAQGAATAMNNSPALAKLGSKMGNTIVTNDGRTFSGGKEVIAGPSDAGLVQGPRGGFKDAETGKRVNPSAAQKRMRAASANMAQPQKQPGAVAGKLAAAGGMVGMGAMMYGMSGGPGADVAGQIAMPLMMLSMVLPMIASKTGMVVAGLLAVAGAITYLVIQSGEATKAGLKMGRAMAMTNKKLEEFASLNGVVTSSQEATRTRENQLAGESAKKRYYGQNFLESEAGKSLLTDAESMTKGGQTNQEIAENFSNQLSYAVLQGAVTQEQAASIAAALGEKLQDYSISATIVGNLTALYGRNGENLLTDPLSISLAIQEQATTQQTAAFENAQTVVSENSANDIATTAGSIAAGLGVITAGLMAFAPATFGLSAVAGAVTGTAAAVAGATALVGTYLTTLEDQQQNNEARGLAVSLGVEQIAQNQGLLDSINDRYDTQVRELELKKASAKTDKEKLEIEDQIAQKNRERASAIFSQKKANKEVFDGLLDQAEAMGPAFNDSVGLAIEDRFKDATGSLKLSAQMAKDALAAMPNTGTDGKFNTFKATVQFGLASGEFSPMAALNLANAAAEDRTIETKFNLLASAQGTAEANQLLLLLGKAGVSSTNYGVILNYFNSNPKTFKEDQEALAQIANMQAEYGIKVDLNVNGQKKIQDVSKFLQATGGLKGKPVTREIVTTYIEDNPNMDATQKANLQEMLSNWDVLTGGDNKVGYQVMVDYVIGKANDAAIWAYYISKNPALANATISVQTSLMPAARAQFFADGQENKNTEAEGDTETPDPAGGKRADVLDDLLKRLQNVRKASVDAKGGMTELMSLLKTGKNFTGFSGIEQQLSLKGYSEEFIRFMADADKADQKRFMSNEKGIVKLKAEGKALQNLFSAVTLGNFERGIRESIGSINRELNARKTIISLTGMSYAEAAEAARDAGLAEAIAAIKSNTAIKNKNKAIREAINLYKEEKAATESAKTMQEKFDDTYNAQMDLINAKQANVNVAFEIETDSFNDAVSSAQADIDKKVNQAGGLDDLQAGLQQITWQEDAINKTYDERLEALDKVERANEKIANQQKSQLSVAEALSKGDISAAALAVQEFRTNAAKTNSQTQRDLIEQSREGELGGLTSTVNGVKKTRKQIEEDILKIEKEIFVIEESRLEPARESIRLATVARDLKLDALDDEKLKWDALKGSVDLASASASIYLATLTAAQALADAAIAEQTAPKPVPPIIPGDQVAPIVTPKKPTVYTVKKGDTLSAIANKNNTTVKKIVAANPKITNPNLIYSGTKITIPTKKASGGLIDFSPFGTDTVPAMLTPGEFVVKKYAVDSFGVDNLKSINNGTYEGNSVYNYELNVNMSGTNLDANDVAKTVMAQIRQIDSQRIRGNNF
jgi:TP901 family phage tail tape measure protein